MKNILCCSVSRYTLQIWKLLPYVIQNLNKYICFYDQGVAIGQKNPSDMPAVQHRRLIKIRQHILQGSDLKFLILVHGAKRACIMCTSDSYLYNQTACFTWWSVNGSFILHDIPS